MNQYYLLELVFYKEKLKRKILYKTEFTRPYCVLNILVKDALSENIKKISEIIYFIFTDNVEYLSNFVDIEIEDELDKLLEKYTMIYNKINFIDGYITYFFDENDTINIYIPLSVSSKNFDNKYYNYNELGTLENYNELICDVDYIREYNKFSVEVKSLFILSRSKLNKEYVNTIIKYRSILHRNYVFDSKEFKQFNTFRDLILYCIESDKKWFNSKRFIAKYKYIIKDISDYKKLINEYYDMIIDVAKGVDI